MPRIDRPHHPTLPALGAPETAPDTPSLVQAPTNRQTDAQDTQKGSERPKHTTAPVAKTPARSVSKQATLRKKTTLPQIDALSPDAQADLDLNEAKTSALLTQWCQAPLVEAMGQLRDWQMQSSALGQVMLGRLAADPACQAKLQGWLAQPERSTHKQRAYVQALQTLIEVAGPYMPAAMVMAQLSVSNAYMAPYNEHHTLLEQLQNELCKGQARSPQEHLKALICASVYLPCGHTQPGPGWVQTHIWLAAVHKLMPSAETDACFADIVTRVLPCDVFTMTNSKGAGASRYDGVVRVMLAWPGAEQLLANSSLAWQRAVVDVADYPSPSKMLSHLVGRLHLLHPDPFDVITHHLNHLRRAADGGLLSPWWTSIHAKRAVQVLTALSEKTDQAVWNQVVHNLLHMPYQRIEPLRAFAAEMLRQKNLQVSSALLVDLLALEPMQYRFERFGEYHAGFWIKPEYLLEAAKTDPKFVLDFVARYQSEILDPRLTFQHARPGGSMADRLGQLAMVHAPEEVGRLRAGQLRAKALHDIWTYLNDGGDDDLPSAFAHAIQTLCDSDVDAQHVLGSRGILAAATGCVHQASPAEQAAFDRLFLWHSVVSGVGIGDDYAVFENLGDEQGYILDPLHPIFTPERGAGFVLPQTLLDALRPHVDLSPASGLDSPHLADTMTVRRRQVVGRLFLMAQIAHCTAPSLAKRQDLIVALVRHPRAYEWPIATMAMVLHCLRNDAKADAAVELVMRLHNQSVPIDLVVSLQIVGALGQAYLTRPEVQYTVASLLRKDSGAERAILQGLTDYGATLTDAILPEFPNYAASTPMFHILRGASSVVTGRVLTEQWMHALVPSAMATPKQESGRLRRAKIAESMLREHETAVRASLPRLADWERVDAQAALQGIDAAFAQQKLAPSPASKSRHHAAQAAPGLFAAKTNVRAVQQFYGDSLLPTTLALLRHHSSLIQLRDKRPDELVQMLNAFLTPAQVLSAIPRLLDAQAWERLDTVCAARPETLALSIKYAHGLEGIAPLWAKGFKQMLGHFAQGTWQRERLKQGAFVGAVQATPNTPDDWTRLWTQGLQQPLAPEALGGSDRPCRLVDSDDFLHTFFSGTDVTGSCQSIHGSAVLNCGLLSRMQMASKRLIAIVDDREKIFARAVFYLTKRQDGGYALFMGPVYGATQADRDETTRLLFAFARRRAQSLGLPLFTADRLGEASAARLTAIEIESLDLPDYIDGEGMSTQRCDINAFATDITQDSLNAPDARSG